MALICRGEMRLRKRAVKTDLHTLGLGTIQSAVRERSPVRLLSNTQEPQIRLGSDMNGRYGAGDYRLYLLMSNTTSSALLLFSDAFLILLVAQLILLHINKRLINISLYTHSWDPCTYPLFPLPLRINLISVNSIMHGTQKSLRS